MRRRWRRPPPGVLVLDLRPIVGAWSQVGRALSTWLGRIRDPRLRYGARNLDRSTGWWQSDMCAAWLHDSCPLPRLCQCASCVRRGLHPGAAQ